MWLRRVGLAILATLACAAALLAIIRAFPPAWASWRPATCLPAHCFCEAIRAGPVRQPANAISSLAFVLVAALVLLSGRTDARSSEGMTSPIHGTGPFPTLFAMALAVIGMGSAFYHASLSFAGQFIDVLGMYLIATFVILYSYGRIRTISGPTLLVGYLSINGGLAWLLFAYPGLRRYAFAIVLLIGLGVEYVARRRSSATLNGRLLGYAILLLAIGFAIWILDITKVACAPNSLLQGHALWHLLGAASSWCLYWYYRSNHRTEQRRPS